jgi:hypothetical protein
MGNEATIPHEGDRRPLPDGKPQEYEVYTEMCQHCGHGPHRGAVCPGGPYEYTGPVTDCNCAQYEARGWVAV